ncbi:MAG: DUF3021 domain-containing protein [Agathobacter sp.]|nr:DUF3021 domain-containing protein [Agathobacter sp.]
MNKSENKPSLWERYLTKEIGIEFKACLYFFAFLFYYCVYRLYIGLEVADILHMAEMIFSTYIVGYIQVFLLWNFDESDSFGKKEILGVLICTSIYAALSYFCGWFDRNIYVTIGFIAYLIFMYICVFLVYKCRRKIDDKILNYDLDMFKTNLNDRKRTK